MILDPGFDLTLRPMKYPVYYDQYKAAIKNTWTVEEVDFSTDLADLRERMTPAEQHLINRLVAFFATGDSIVGNNLVLNLYKHINSPEARMYLSRQLFEEAQHVEFYLTLLDSYIAEPEERKRAFDAVENIASIRKKAEFCFRWIDSINGLTEIRTVRHQEPDLVDKDLEQRVTAMLEDAVECEMAFADDVLSLGVSGLSPTDMREYLQYVADRRLEALGVAPVFGSKNPFGFMELQDVQELTNFFERRVSAYQVAVKGEVAFHDDF